MWTISRLLRFLSGIQQQLKPREGLVIEDLDEHLEQLHDQLSMTTSSPEQRFELERLRREEQRSESQAQKEAKKNSKKAEKKAKKAAKKNKPSPDDIPTQRTEEDAPLPGAEGDEHETNLEAEERLREEEKRQSALLPPAETQSMRLQARAGEGTARLFVLDFRGDVQASQVQLLREEVTAIISSATGEDEVLLRLESPGGTVVGYGLAAAQLDRLKRAGLPLTVAVDKVAASGGYMMACVADRIVAAPFALLGSIGVVAQLPNLHRFLDDKKIDIEQHTAGRYKRTLTLLGENSDEGREKFKEELGEVHVLFKTFVAERRPTLEIEEVATGESWYGHDALQRGLADEICSSDDLLLRARGQRRIFKVRYLREEKGSVKLKRLAYDLLARLGVSL
ncbi:MAG: protease SohB [Myxococcota bacterium]|nr:protease SohB [Myxococcota bacterium]